MNCKMIACAALYCLLIVGCGNNLSTVSGTVLMDDKPLAEGDIIFEEADQSKTPEAAKIKDGKYTIQVLPGSKKCVSRHHAPPPSPIL